MASLSVIHISECQKWDEIVQSFHQYDVYYLRGYVKAFQIHGDGEPMLFYYEDASIRGINVAMQRDIALLPGFQGMIDANTYFDFATPYGYGGWLVAGNGSTKRLFSEYACWCQNHGIVSEFVRFHPLLENAEYASDFYDTTCLGHTITMDISSEKCIWDNLTSKNRNMVRKAEKSGIKVYHGRHAALFKVFKSIYDATMDRDHASTYYYFRWEFYQSMLDDLPESAQIFYAELDGQVIATAIILSANGCLHYHLSGSNPQFRHLAPSNLLLYQVARWGCANGCKTLHLGGGVGAKEDGLFSFKKSFYRGDKTQYCIGKKIFLLEEYNRLCAINSIPLNTGFFPAYRDG